MVNGFELFGMGYSWGGFAGLQVAARRPPELGAVVSINSTVRRYTDEMNRLYGVTMAERGISQLVSVDLETAAKIREAV